MDKNTNFDELEKEIQNYKEMSTSINRIKNKETESDNEFEREPFSDVNLNKKENFSVDNFVKDLETNLDNFDKREPMPSNLSFINETQKKKIEYLENTVLDDKVKSKELDNVKEPEKVSSTNWKELIYTFLVEIKEPVIIIILFILVNNQDFIRVVAKIPYLNRLNNIYPSLILRGLILATIIYLLRKNK